MNVCYWHCEYVPFFQANTVCKIPLEKLLDLGVNPLLTWTEKFLDQITFIKLLFSNWFFTSAVFVIQGHIFWPLCHILHISVPHPVANCVCFLSSPSNLLKTLLYSQSSTDLDNLYHCNVAMLVPRYIYCLKIPVSEGSDLLFAVMKYCADGARDSFIITMIFFSWSCSQFFTCCGMLWLF